ncbi:MAG: ATP-binding protein, partial [Clostridia bacterium]|nr:ATP-binding protein [Clostridia bacterium]
MNTPKINQLVLYRDILNDPAIESAHQIWLYQDDNQYSQIEDQYYCLQSLLLNQKTCMSWKEYVGELIASSENMFSLLSEKGLEKQPILKIAEQDIHIISEIYHYDWSKIEKKLSVESSVFCLNNISDQDVCSILERKTGIEAVYSLKQYYKLKGCGMFRKYAAFKWNDSTGLTGIDCYDSISFDDLTGYEPQKKTLCENTEFFIKGLKANNVLLYG